MRYGSVYTSLLFPHPSLLRLREGQALPEGLRAFAAQPTAYGDFMAKISRMRFILESLDEM